jgi:ribosomal protein L40E
VLRFGIVAAFVAVAAGLVVAAVLTGSGDVAGAAFILFLAAAIGFAYAFLRFVPWQCWNCMTRNPHRSPRCRSCGTTHIESMRLQAEGEDY